MYRVMMDRDNFLASGLLEQYALGLTSPEETQLVEHFVETDPEIRKKLTALQQTVEQYASRYAMPPPRRLKKRILSEIEEEEDPSRRKRLVSTTPAKRAPIGLVGTIIAGVLLIGFLLWREQQLEANNRELSGKLRYSQSLYDNLQKEETLADRIFNYIENGNTDVVHLRGSKVAKDAHAVVYWNPDEKKAHIKLVKMPAVPSGKQFQIWAEVNGKMVHAGLLDEAHQELQVVKYIKDATSLNITMEPLGGSENPSVILLIANGKI